MTTANTVSINRTILETLLANTCNDTEPATVAIETVKKEIRKQTTSETDTINSLPTDTIFEHYGYGVYNTHTQSFIVLPDEIHSVNTVSHDSEPLVNHNVHICQEWDAELLARIKEQYALDSVKHLRVVTVHLDNVRDTESIKHI